MSVHHLVSTAPDGRSLESGGMLTEMKLHRSNGPLHVISVEPAEMEDIQHELFDSAGIKVTMGDTHSWMEPQEVEAFILLLQQAHDMFLWRLRVHVNGN